MKLRLRSQVYVLVGALALWAAEPVAPSFAQDAPAAAKKKDRKKRKGKKQREKASAARGGAPSAPAEAEVAPKTEPKTADKGTSGKGAPAPTSARDQARQAAQDAAQGVNTEIVKEGETSVKMMQFSGLDIEGRLKSPQLLYFVNRVRAEFDRPRLPHRSFMPEVERSTHQEPLR
jgi:hypothetical protein